ncbi:MAG: 5-methyltetrahydropteroyltriglutamate--homocysteine S-methyltransferase [Chloroflexota bacterium]
MSKSTNLGYPRIGKHRELKRVIERYWRDRASQEDIERVSKEIRTASLETQKSAGIDLIPTGDFSLYDHVLDTVALWGLVPDRFHHQRGDEITMDTYFAMARGDDQTAALELTKWFDTNYHYLVPEFDAGEPHRATNKPVEDYREAKSIVGDSAKPVLLGPVTFLLLGKHHNASLAEHLDQLLPLYVDLLNELADEGAEWVQIDEPSLVEDRSADELALFERAYASLGEAKPNIMLQTYFGSLRDNWNTVINLPVAGIGLDFVRTPSNLEDLMNNGFPEDKVLNAGIVNGRGVWKTDLTQAIGALGQISAEVPADRLWIGPSSSLLFLPHDVRLEDHDPDLLENLAFAEQRLAEIAILTKGLTQGSEAIAEQLAEDRKRQERFLTSSMRHEPTNQRIKSLTEEDFRRATPVDERLEIQAKALNLPPYPTTTIGSFPQTSDVRKMRARRKTGKISEEEYQQYVRSKIDELIDLQEKAGLDVLVHGEFERSDMVEFFAEKLSGFIATKNGWVQSYGTRCVRPPIIIGDVHRPEPMTIDEITYAQSKTDKPVKGMLTGPVTILNWSFPREDIPRSEIAYQIALALRDEVADLEKAGIKVIQIDEPALREGLPLVQAEWQDYLDWAIKAFRLASSGVKDETQIHTHMCYSEFNDIIDSIDAMDADVISIENSRSNEELLRAFTDYKYAGQIGPGVYDVHSARVPESGEMTERLQNAANVLGSRAIWVNPDCGLKTRRDEEVWPALSNMVSAAQALR